MKSWRSPKRIRYGVNACIQYVSIVYIALLYHKLLVLHISALKNNDYPVDSDEHTLSGPSKDPETKMSLIPNKTLFPEKIQRKLSNSSMRVNYTIETLITSEAPTSTVHCFGETFNESRIDSPASLYRSCRFENLCYDFNGNDFVLFPSQKHLHLFSKLHSDIFLSSVPKAVMLSEVIHSNPDQTPQVFPKYQRTRKQDRYHIAVEKSTVWIPLQPHSCTSILWDIFLPIYTLLELFSLQDKRFIILLLEGTKCSPRTIRNFANTMGGVHANFSVVAVRDWKLSTQFNIENTTHKDYICFHESVMGLGAHGDHQAFRSTQYGEDYKKKRTPPNHLRRESNLRGFRNFWLRHWNLVPAHQTPLKMAYSSHISRRSISSMTEISGIEILVWPSKASTQIKLEMVIYLSVLVLSSKEDLTAAFFLPEGATLILLGETNEDWDLWSNNSQLRVHLLERKATSTLQYLIREVIIRWNQDNAKKLSKPDNASWVFADQQNVVLVNGTPPTTRMHCVGEKLFPNHLGSEWFRTCHYENICFDLWKKKFVAFLSSQSQEMMSTAKIIKRREQIYLSSMLQKQVVSPQLNKLGGGYPFYADIPQIVDLSNVSSYYLYEGTWLSTQVFSSVNSGHVLWDVFLPLFSLLDMFDLDKHKILVTLFPSKTSTRQVYAFLATAFGMKGNLMSNEILKIPNSQSRYVCALNGGSGYGWLMDHGFGDHGWRENDTMYPVNLRRGPELLRYRNFMLENLKIPTELHSNAKVQIVFSINSSFDLQRRINFQQEFRSIKKLHLPTNLYDVQRHHLVSFPLRKQIEIAAETSIFISVVGGGTFPAFFLPRGSTLILYGDRSMHLDFDIFNNCGHLRVHWMSLHSRVNDTGIFADLIQDEIATRRWSTH